MAQMKNHLMQVEARRGEIIEQLDDLMQHMADLGWEDIAGTLDLVLKTYDQRARAWGRA